MSDQVIALRSESLAAQSMRFDLAKFKLVTTAVLGSLVIGAGATASTRQIPYVIGLIPIVCIYIDLIANAKQIQVLVIGKFLQKSNLGIFSEYESFCSELRNSKRVFLDSYAFHFSTVLICVSIAAYGLGKLIFLSNFDPFEVTVEISSGALGLAISILLQRIYRGKAARLNESV